MGVVYKAEDARLHRFVALKFLPDEVARDTEGLARFRREAQAASALNHPNICGIYDIGEENGKAFVAIDVSRWDDIEHRIAGKSLELETVLSLGIEIADALDTAHGAGSLSSGRHTRARLGIQNMPLVLAAGAFGPRCAVKERRAADLAHRQLPLPQRETHRVT